jgi:hypothetical protein
MQALQQAMRLLLFLSSLLFVSVRPQKLPVVINTWVRLCLFACHQACLQPEHSLQPSFSQRAVSRPVRSPTPLPRATK